MPFLHAIALRVSFGATVCAGVCAHFAGWFGVCCGCVLCSWRAAGSSVRLRSDLVLFVPACRSLPECLHPYIPVRVKDQTLSITRETCPVGVFNYLQSLFSYCEIGKLLLSVPIVSENVFFFFCEGLRTVLGTEKKG